VFFWVESFSLPPTPEMEDRNQSSS